MSRNTLRVWREVPSAGCPTRSLSSTPLSYQKTTDKTYIHNTKERKSFPKAQDFSSVAGRDKDAAPVHKGRNERFSSPAWVLPWHVLVNPVTINSPYKDLLRFFRRPNRKFTWFHSKHRNEYAIESLAFAKHRCSARRAKTNLENTSIRLKHAKQHERKLLRFLLACFQQSFDALQKVAPIRKHVATQLEIVGLLTKIMKPWPDIHRTRLSTALRLFKINVLSIEGDANGLLVYSRERPVLQANERFIEHMERLYLIFNTENEDLKFVNKNLQDIRHGAKSSQGTRKLQLQGASHVTYLLQLQEKYILLLELDVWKKISQLSLNEPEMSPGLATYVLLDQLRFATTRSLKALATFSGEYSITGDTRMSFHTSKNQKHNPRYLFWSRLQLGQATLALLFYELRDLKKELYLLSAFRATHTESKPPPHIVAKNQQIIQHVADEYRAELIKRWLSTKPSANNQMYHRMLPQLEKFFNLQKYAKLKKQVYRYARDAYAQNLDQVLEKRRNTKSRPRKADHERVLSCWKPRVNIYSGVGVPKRPSHSECLALGTPSRRETPEKVAVKRSTRGLYADVPKSNVGRYCQSPEVLPITLSKNRPVSKTT